MNTVADLYLPHERQCVQHYDLLEGIVPTVHKDGSLAARQFFRHDGVPANYEAVVKSGVGRKVDRKWRLHGFVRQRI
jgi:hypothetical protein